MPRKTKKTEVELTEQDLQEVKNQKLIKMKTEKLNEFLKKENIEIVSGIPKNKISELVDVSIKNPQSQFLKISYGIKLTQN